MTFGRALAALSPQLCHLIFLIHVFPCTKQELECSCNKIFLKASTLTLYGCIFQTNTYPRNVSISSMVKNCDLIFFYLATSRLMQSQLQFIFFLSDFSNVNLKRNDVVSCDGFTVFCDTSMCYTKGRHCY